MAAGRTRPHAGTLADRYGLDVQSTVHRLDTSANILRWRAALRGRVHSLWRSATGGGRATAPVATPEPTPRLGLNRQWEMVTGLIARDVSRADEIAAIQARAAVKIDAAEHALNLTIADCAKILATAGAATLRWPVRRPTRLAEPRRSLAA